MVSVIHPSSTQQALKNTSHSYYSSHSSSSGSHGYPANTSWTSWPSYSPIFSSSPYNQMSSHLNSNKSIYPHVLKPSRRCYVYEENKDYSLPLFVDCSMEYELPNAPVIPNNSLPVLMIHPSFSRTRIMNSSSPQGTSEGCRKRSYCQMSREEETLRDSSVCSSDPWFHQGDSVKTSVIHSQVHEVEEPKSKKSSSSFRPPLP